MSEFRLEIFYRKRTIITKIFLKIHLDIRFTTEEHDIIRIVLDVA